MPNVCDIHKFISNFKSLCWFPCHWIMEYIWRRVFFFKFAIYITFWISCFGIVYLCPTIIIQVNCDPRLLVHKNLMTVCKVQIQSSIFGNCYSISHFKLKKMKKVWRWYAYQVWVVENVCFLGVCQGEHAKRGPIKCFPHIPKIIGQPKQNFAWWTEEQNMKPQTNRTQGLLVNMCCIYLASSVQALWLPLSKI